MSKKSRDPVQAFRYDADTLPRQIEKAALASGGFPYDKKLDQKRYEKDLRLLQIELVKVQNWVKTTGERVAIVFEGRDAAGKGGAIQRLTQHLNPRSARIVALSKPTTTEAGQWYFQRYAAKMPTRGELAIFDRSWYGRVLVERVEELLVEMLRNRDHWLRHVVGTQRHELERGLVAEQVLEEVRRQLGEGVVRRREDRERARAREHRAEAGDRDGRDGRDRDYRDPGWRTHGAAGAV